MREPVSRRPADALPPLAELPVLAELPDPLVQLDGRRSMSPEQWFAIRRPELLRSFEHYMYGYAPAPPALRVRVVELAGGALGGRARLEQAQIEIDAADSPGRLELLLALPAGASTRVPVFLGPNFAGNHTIVLDSSVPEPSSCPPGCHPRAARGSAASAWNVERIIERGYGLATFHTCDIKPDRPLAHEGWAPWFWTVGQKEPEPRAWGALRMWAWAISRAVDHLVTHPLVDARRIAVVGHSRLGKAALVAAAFDERLALAIALQAGCGGSAPSRTRVGESVAQITRGFPHWFNAEFTQFGAAPERLPFDQHGLLALVAPRPVLFANAVEDTWANPVGQFAMLRAVEPVYRLLGVSGLESAELPSVGALSAGRLGYFLRAGTHSMTPEDWGAFLDFSDRHLAKPASEVG